MPAFTKFNTCLIIGQWGIRGTYHEQKFHKRAIDVTVNDTVGSELFRIRAESYSNLHKLVPAG